MTQPISPLVADLMSASLAQTHAVTNSVIDNLTERAELAEATLTAIMVGVDELLDGDYMPTSDAIRRAMLPSRATVDRFRPGGGS